MLADVDLAGRLPPERKVLRSNLMHEIILNAYGVNSVVLRICIAQRLKSLYSSRAMLRTSPSSLAQ